MWKQIVGAPSMDGLVKKPDVLSFYIASKIPVSESTRQELLDIDCISYRLRREIELLESINLVRCKICQVTTIIPMPHNTIQFISLYVASSNNLGVILFFFIFHQVQILINFLLQYFKISRL